MPCISGSYNPAVGPIIQVAIVDAKLALGGVQNVGPKLSIYSALIDTGATSTCITQRVIDEVGLVPVGKTRMTGATGESIVDQYAFGVGFMLNSRQTPTGEVQADLSIASVQGCVFHNGSVAFDILLGRDIICRGAFVLSFDGHFTLSI
jgi:predicted aspartyl protease